MPPVTRSRAAAPAKPTRTTTRTTTTTTTSSAAQRAVEPLPKPTARVTKRVAFEVTPDNEKENEPPVKKARGRSAPSKPSSNPSVKPPPAKSALKTSSDTAKPTGLRAKPLRKPTTAKKAAEQISKPTASSSRPRTTTKTPLLDATRVLTPKKITQVAKATPKKYGSPSDSEDELNGGKTPIKNLAMSPKRPPSPLKMLSPAKLPFPARQVLQVSPPQLRSPERPSTLLDRLPQRSPLRLQSPERERPGLLVPTTNLSPKRTPNINFDQSILDTRSPLKLSPSSVLPDPFVEENGLAKTPIGPATPVLSIPAPATPQEPVPTPENDSDDVRVTPIFNEFINPSPVADNPLFYLHGVVCFLDIRTAEGADANGFFVKVLNTWGAKIVSQFRLPDATVTPGNHDFKSITHVIWKDGSPKTLEKVQAAYRHGHKIHCVGVNWIADSEKHSARMPEADYTIDIKQRLAESGSRRRRRTMEPGVITPAGHGSVKKVYRGKRTTLLNPDALKLLANTPIRHYDTYKDILNDPDLPPLPKQLAPSYPLMLDGQDDPEEANITPKNNLITAMSPIKPYEPYNPATAQTPVAHTPLHKLLQKTAPAKRTFRGLFTELDDKYDSETPASVKKVRRNSDV